MKALCSADGRQNVFSLSFYTKYDFSILYYIPIDEIKETLIVNYYYDKEIINNRYLCNDFQTRATNKIKDNKYSWKQTVAKMSGHIDINVFPCTILKKINHNQVLRKCSSVVNGSQS